nr:MAG TPA: hypothetical protein [Caudoviricetes sp.]
MHNLPLYHIKIHCHTLEGNAIENVGIPFYALQKTLCRLCTSFAKHCLYYNLLYE